MKPYKCPICLGRGVMPIYFYEQDTENITAAGSIDVTCRSCKGEGILWDREYTPYNPEYYKYWFE